MGQPIFVEPVQEAKPSGEAECAWQSFARRLRLPSQGHSAGPQTDAGVDALLEGLREPLLRPPAAIATHWHMSTVCL